MKRRIFTILSAVSLVVWVVVAAEWPRSHWYTDRLDCVHRAHTIRVQSFRGTVCANNQWNGDLVSSTEFKWFSQSFAGNLATPAAYAADWMYFRRGFGFNGKRTAPRNTTLKGSSIVQISIPLWFLIAVTGIPPMIWLWVRVRRHQRQRLIV